VLQCYVYGVLESACVLSCWCAVCVMSLAWFLVYCLWCILGGVASRSASVDIGTRCTVSGVGYLGLYVRV